MSSRLPVLLLASLIALAGCTQHEHSTTFETDAKAPQITAADYQRAEQFLYWNKDDYIRNESILPNWINGSDDFWYQRKLSPTTSEFIRVTAATGEKSPAFDHAQVAAELSRLTEENVTANALPFVSFNYSEKGTITFQVGLFQYSCDARSCEQSEASMPTPGETVSPDGNWAVYFKDHNLWVRATDGSTEFALTTDGEQDNTYGISTDTDLSPVTRKRLGQVDAPLVMFSPDGSKLLTQKIDQRQVGRLHLLQHAPEDGSYRPVLYSYRYALSLDEHKPMATFVVFDLPSGSRTDIDYPAIPLAFAPHIHPMAREAHWQADSRDFWFVHRNSKGAGYSIHQVNATTGNTTKIAERKADALAFPAPSQAMPAVVKPVGTKGIVWYSDESGWGHLYYSEPGQSPLQLTDGPWGVLQIVHLDEQSGMVYFTRGQDEAETNPYHVVLSRVSLEGGDIDTLTSAPGTHQISAASFSPSGNYFIDSFASLEQAGTTVLRSTDGNTAVELERADTTDYEALGVSAPERFEAIAADGKTRIWGNIFKPSNFDPNKSYPVVDSIYPGPQSGRLQHSLTAAMYSPFETQSIAELGFIAIVIEGRGTPGRSRSFHYDHGGSLLGEAGYLQDHIAAMQQLAERRPWMDLERVGIFGHSGGGYASTHALLEYPDFFKVAVSSAGNHEQRVYLPIWGESYLGEDSDNNYSQASNPDLAANLQGKLFIIIGDMDDNVHPAASYQLVDALIKANKDFDMLSLPNANHGFMSLTNAEQSYFMRRRWDYFVEHLLGAQPPAGYQITNPALAGKQ